MNPIARVAMRIAAPLFVILSISSTAFAGLSPEAELTVYRFFGRPDTNSAFTGTYDLRNGLWRPKRAELVDVKVDESCTTALLDDLQKFSLNVMTKVDYLSPGELSHQEKLIENFSPEQVTFLELVEPVLKSVVESDPKEYPAYRISQRKDADRPNHDLVRQAGLWIVAAQSLYPWGHDIHQIQYPDAERIYEVPWQNAMTGKHDPNSQDRRDPHEILVNITPMPWQMSPELWESGGFEKSKLGNFAELDRNKYPLRWEIGRGAQVKPEQAAALYSAAVAAIDEEITATYQGREEDAYIFVKALDEDRYRLFHAAGFRPLEGACLTPAHCVMVAPFTTLKKRFGLAKQSFRLDEIRKQFGAGFPVENAINFMHRAQTYFRADLDVILKERGYSQKSPIVVHDFSRNYYLLLRVLAQRFGGLPMDKAIDFARQTGTYRTDEGSRYGIREIIPATYFMKPFTENDVVRITNLDPELAKHDPEYLPIALLGVREYLLYRYHEVGVSDPMRVLEQVNTKIAIQTLSPVIASQAVHAGGVLADPIRGQDGRIVHTILFDLARLARLEAQNPERARLGRNGVMQGFWFFRSIAANPFKF